LEKTPKKFALDLLANARDSLAHAVLHLAGDQDATPGRWKIAIREVAHVIELLLKERLRQAHPALIWIKVDEFPSLDARTVGTDLAANRLAKMCGIGFSKSALETLEACRKLRNKIEHYEFQVDEAEARGIVGRMLSFIFVFSKAHLKLDLEDTFRKDKSWKSLIDLVEFREAQSAAIAKQFAEDGTGSADCESCGEPTFDVGSEQCALCGHVDSLVECASCKEMIWLSDAEDVGTDEAEEEQFICSSCIHKAEAADFYYDAWKDEQAMREP
jgi:hypothetical protein